MWTPEGIRPIVTVTGSHQRTCVFGTITIDGKQLFRQYDVFNQYVFLKYLKELQRKFRKLLLFIDRAVQHRSSIMVRKHLEENKDVIRVEYLPKGSSDYNAVEECWRQGKDDLLVSKYYPKFFNLKSAIANYYRTRRFKLDITKYLFRKDSQRINVIEYNKVATAWFVEATHEKDFRGIPATHKKFETVGMNVFHFEGNKIKEAWFIADGLTPALELGIVETKSNENSQLL